MIPVISRFFRRTLLTKLILPIAIPLGLTACVTPPVQEMSDARQAIRSAEEIGAAQYSPENMRMAWRLLQKAQTRLEAGAYDDARQHALDARSAALKARERASATHLTSP